MLFIKLAHSTFNLYFNPKTILIFNNYSIKAYNKLSEVVLYAVDKYVFAYS